MEYIFYKVSIVEYQKPGYEPGPELTSQDDPTREEVMELLEIQQPNYFENLEGLYNNKHVIRVNEIGVGYTYWMLTPISIAYQAERIQMAKASIRISINNKGGTITTEERLDKFAGYIDLLPAVVELTQAQYDALPVYDNNTYYLIVEE